MQHSQSVKRGRAREVPFGVRALESGIEVEGVWISGTNTPAGSTPGTPTFLANANSTREKPSPDRVSSASVMSHPEMSHLEMPQSTQGYPTVMIASESNSQDSSPLADRRVSSDSTQQPPPKSDPMPHRRPSYKPRRSSQLRYSNSMRSEDPKSVAAHDDHYLVSRGKGKERQGKFLGVLFLTAMCLHYKLGSESECEGQGRPLTEGFRSPKDDHHETSYQRSRSEMPADEFLHAAYPNHPRIPRTTTNGLSDIDTRGSSTHEAHFHEQGHLQGTQSNGMTAAYEAGQHGRRNKTKDPALRGKNPFATPPRRPSDDDAPVFHIDDDSTAYPILTHDGTTEQPSSGDPLMLIDASRQPKGPQVVRKVNSGFQILAPGTFDAPIPDDVGRKEVIPGNKRHSRKLQKRSRANSYSIEEP